MWWLLANGRQSTARDGQASHANGFQGAIEGAEEQTLGEKALPHTRMDGHGKLDRRARRVCPETMGTELSDGHLTFDDDDVTISWH